MTTHNKKFSLLAALALCLGLLASPSAFGQARTGGGGGGGGGGFGGGGGGGGFGGGGAARAASSSGSASSSSGTTYAPNGTVGTANFYVDQESRKLVVIADAETAKYVAQVVSNLSIPKPQVLIKVVFVEVTYNNNSDIGLEGGITKHITANPSTTLGISNLFGLASQGVKPTTGITTLPGAGLYTIVGDDFSATLRAIAERGKVEVLSRPSILARNNQEATIVVGQQVPLITGVTYDTFGNQRNSISYQNVGIILQVTPFITSDDMVEMIVAPQISSVDPTQSQVIATGNSTNGGTVTAPYLDIRSANTVVVTPNGQTVVIGGLMQNTRSSTDSKIPLVGDIPWLGALFHHKVSTDAKTELLIFLTPYVVKTPMDLARMSSDERSRSDLPHKAFSDKELNQFLDAAPLHPAPGAASPSPHARQ